MGRDVKPIGQLLKEMMKAYKIDDRATEMQIRERWTEIVGEMVSSNTQKLYLKKEILYVHIQSSVIRHEVAYHQSVLLERIATLIGSSSVKEIKLLA